MNTETYKARAYYPEGYTYDRIEIESETEFKEICSAYKKLGYLVNQCSDTWQDTGLKTKEYPAGRYWVGDLCYLNINREHVCAENGDFAVDGIETWHHRTAFGDGDYKSNKGITFPVDSGSIGIVKADVATTVGYRPGYIAGFVPGHIVDLKDAFTPVFKGSTFYIGSLEIYTDDGGWG